MKKLFIGMIAVLVVSALMISCNSEPGSPSDGRLVSVKVNNPNYSKAMYASSVPTTDIEDLYWYYTAEKDDNSMFITGQQRDKKLIEKFRDDSGKNKGLWLADLGLFSTGSWRFSFYGYYPVNDAPPNLEEAAPAYQCINLFVTITEDTSITVTLEGGAGLENAYVKFGEMYWSYEGAGRQAGTELTLTIHADEYDNVLASGTAEIDENGAVVFSGISDEPVLSPGLHMLLFEVKSETGEEVGRSYVYVYASNGSVINISGDIENLDQQGSAYVGDTIIEYKTVAYTITSTKANKEIEVEFALSPDLTSRETEVEFPRGSVHKTTDSEGITTTSTLIFTVLKNTKYPDAVAAFRLELVKTKTDRNGNIISVESSNEFAQLVEIETYIPNGLANVTVKDKEGNEINNIVYKRSSGELEFKTYTLTEFYIFAE